MGSLHSLDLFTSPPIPEIKGLILRPTDDLIGSLIVVHSHCMLVLAILTDRLLSGKVPDDCLVVP